MPTVSETQERILSTALALFCRNGYAAVGTQDICNAAGVQKGSLYHFYPSKLDVALAALKHFGESATLDFAAIAEGPGTPAEKVLAVFAMEYGVAVRQKNQSGKVYGCLMANMTYELSPKETAIRDLVERLYGEWAKALRPIFAGDADPEESGRILLTHMNGAILMAIAHNDPNQIRSLGKSALKLFGFEKTPAAKKRTPAKK